MRFADAMSPQALPRFAGTTVAAPGKAAPRRIWPWAAAGAAGGALAMLVLQFPAHWVTPAIARASGERVLFSDVRGTVWQGSAVLSLSAGPGSHDLLALPGRTIWRLRPSADGAAAEGETPQGFGAGFRLVVDQTCCLDRPLEAHIALATNGIDVRVGDTRWRGPASIAQGLGTPWNTLAFDGDLQMSTHALRVRTHGGRTHLAGRLSMTADSVSSRISFVRPLGSYRFDIDGARADDQGAPLRFKLATLKGPLRLDGQGTWTAGQFRFQGEARAESGRGEALNNVLNLIGNRNGPLALRVVR